MSYMFSMPSSEFCSDFAHYWVLMQDFFDGLCAGPKAKQLEGEECPLHIKHPPTGEEFALGCGVCRNTHTF